MEKVFRALSDPSRRQLLDLLFQQDGQTLRQLDAALPAMTRFGTMKHLRVLEAAGLVVTRRVGREKFHYLNPVPIRLLHDRWISKYAAPVVAAMGRLKTALEESDMKPKHVFEVYIRTTPEKLWQAITDPAFTRQYYHATDIRSDWKVGSKVEYLQADGVVALTGSILEMSPPTKLVHTFGALYDPEAAKDRPSRVTWEIVPRGEACQLTLTHDDFDGETKTWQSVKGGWSPILSRLKTLLETGKPLNIAPAASAATM